MTQHKPSAPDVPSMPTDDSSPGGPGPRDNSDDPSIPSSLDDELQLGRRFMREYSETFRDLAR